jgi:hypothetical protein
MPVIAHWLWDAWRAFVHGTGIDAGPTWPYGFWSGFGSCITEFVIIGAVWHKVNCGVKGCYRVGLRKVPGTEHVVCHRHHPHGKPTAQDVLDDHRAAQERGN